MTHPQSDRAVYPVDPETLHKAKIVGKAVAAILGIGLTDVRAVTVQPEGVAVETYCRNQAGERFTDRFGRPATSLAFYEAARA